MTTTAPPQSRPGTVFRVVSGNFMEMFDFFPVSYTHLTLPTKA